MPQLRYILRYLSELKGTDLWCPHDGHELAGALVSSSRIATRDRGWKHCAISTAKQLLRERPCEDQFADEDLHLLREVERLENFFKLEGAVVGQVTVTDPRSNVQYGQIMITNAHRSIVANDLPGALKKLDLIIPFDQEHRSYSRAEKFVQMRVDLWRTKIDRYKGNFALCEERIIPLLALDEHYGKIGTRLISTYAEVLCEMERSAEAEKLLKEPLHIFEEYGWTKIRKGRLLRCSMADVLLSKKSYCAAYDLYQNVKNDGDSSHSPSTDVDYFHHLVGLAMSSHLDNCLDKAHTHWTDVIFKISQWGWVGGFSEMVTCYAISDIKFKQKQAEAT